MSEAAGLNVDFMAPGVENVTAIITLIFRDGVDRDLDVLPTVARLLNGSFKPAVYAMEPPGLTLTWNASNWPTSTLVYVPELRFTLNMRPVISPPMSRSPSGWNAMPSAPAWSTGGLLMTCSVLAMGAGVPTLSTCEPRL